MTTETENATTPSREQVIAWYKDQIELATLRAELAELQSRAVKAEAERTQAAMFLAQMDAANKEMKAESSDNEEREKPNT